MALILANSVSSAPAPITTPLWIYVPAASETRKSSIITAGYSTLTFTSVEGGFYVFDENGNTIQTVNAANTPVDVSSYDYVQIKVTAASEQSASFTLS